MPTFAPVASPAASPARVMVSVPEALEPWPTEPVEDPTIDATVPERFQVAVATIGPGRATRGEILAATVESYSEALDWSGRLVMSVPTNDASLLPTLLADLDTWGGRRTGTLDDLVNRALVVCRNGVPEVPYVLRGPVGPRDGTVQITAQQAERLFEDRFVGAATRIDYFDGRGTFETDVAPLAVTAYGDATWGIDDDTAAKGERSLWVRGTPNRANFVRISTVLTAGEGVTEERVTVRAGAYVLVPQSAFDDMGLITVTVRRIGESTAYWPRPGEANYGASIVRPDLPRDGWSYDPETAIASLPPPPYSVYVHVDLFPTHETDKTRFDQLTLFKRDTLSTGVPRDLVEHLAILLRDAQTGRGKSSWGLGVVVEDLVGVSELGVWRHEDDQPLPEAIEAICGRDDGPDPPWIDGRWVAHCTARRGEDLDLIVGPDDIVDDQGWMNDPGDQVSAMRGLTDRGDGYWRVSSEARSTRFTAGQVIERLVRAPNGLSLDQVDAWTLAQLTQHARPQATARIVVPSALGRRINLGDRFRYVAVDGYLRMDRTVRCVQRTVVPRSGTVALDVGADD